MDDNNTFLIEQVKALQREVARLNLIIESQKVIINKSKKKSK